MKSFTNREQSEIRGEKKCTAQGLFFLDVLFSFALCTDTYPFFLNKIKSSTSRNKSVEQTVIMY